MKRLSRVLPLLLTAILAALPLYAQNSGSASGKILGRDGQPAQNIQVKIDSLLTNNGRLQVRESLTAKTGKNGEFSLSGLYAGRIVITVMENGQPVYVKGEKTGDEIFLANGIDYRMPTLDMSKLEKPAAPAAGAPAAGPDTSKMSAADREALKKKLEAEAAASGEASKAFEAGKSAFTAKDYPESIKQFKVAAEKNPSQDVIWANLGRAYDANAAASLTKAGREPDADAKAELNKSAQTDYDSAIAAYNKAIEIKPIESNYYVNLSLAQLGAGKIDDSKAAIEKAAALNPASAAQAYYNLGATLINRNKYDEAVAPLKKAIELDSKYAPAYFQLGLTSVSKGDPTGVEYLQKCLDLPNCPDTTTAKGLIDALKATAPTAFQSPDKAKADADAKAKASQPAKGGKTKN